MMSHTTKNLQKNNKDIGNATCYQKILMLAFSCLHSINCHKWTRDIGLKVWSLILLLDRFAIIATQRRTVQLFHEFRREFHTQTQSHSATLATSSEHFKWVIVVKSTMTDWSHWSHKSFTIHPVLCYYKNSLIELKNNSGIYRCKHSTFDN